MASKRSKCLFLFLLVMGSMNAQYIETYDDYEDTLINTTESADYGVIGFSDSDKVQFNALEIDQNLDETKWKRLYEKVEFKETSDSVKTNKVKEKPKTKLNKSEITRVGRINLSWLWYTLAFSVILAVLVLIFSKFNTWNRKNKEQDDFIFSDDNPDEDVLRQSDLRSAFQKAYDKGDYKSAFRLLYLDTLKRFVEKNWIIYRKDKTNFEYLMQLNSKPVFGSFSRLTLAFDAIWYGDIMPDKKDFEMYLNLFSEIESEVKRA